MSADGKQTSIHYYTLAEDEVVGLLNGSRNGLTEAEALKRLEEYGRNELTEARRRTVFEKFLQQFKDVMVLILIAAAAISLFMGERTDSLIILAIVIINAVMGVVQESKAEKALEALKSMSKPYAKVKRDGRVNTISSSEIVPGDIVIVEAGDFIPADLRLLEIASLKLEEAALTGESVPVEKTVERIEAADIVLGDRKNMAYSGSSVSYGRGIGIAVNTGMNTEVGKIAGYIANEETEQTPLQKKLAEMGKFLSVGVIIIAVVILATGLLRGREPFEMFLTSVSLAVAAIPEGLPAIVTIVLAIGVQKMSKRNAIIRKLPAVETLGSTEIICSDKTGTLTQNKMTVKELHFNGRSFTGEAAANDAPGFEELVLALALCNDSKPSKENQHYRYTGDPTETALVYYASSKDYHKEELDGTYPRKSEVPFDSVRKLMSTVNEINGNLRVMTKGAPDVLADKCSHIAHEGRVLPFTDELREQVSRANSGMASKALRVLAVAYKNIEALPQAPEELEQELVFIGLVGMMDPPREEAKEAVRICRAAGIKPVMVTGDHRDTAAAIAKELEILKEDSEVITGAELDKITEEEFGRRVKDYSVYARVSPEHKVRIVNAWRNNDKIVAMTGDGVNDAPALRAADIGVGMGITGTDVSKSVSDMVLTDDNFATIVAAVREGRKIYSNIRKAVQFLLSANMGEVATLFVATMLNWKILFPIHILWINLVTDALPALSLGAEEAEKDIMDRKPNKSGFFSEGFGVNIVYQGILEAFLTLGTYALGLRMFTPEVAVTMAFVTLGLIQLFHSFNVRSSTKSIFQIGPFSNKYLVGAAVISGFLQVVVVLVPQLNPVFRVTPLTPAQWLITLIASFLIIPIVELVKLIQRRRQV